MTRPALLPISFLRRGLDRARAVARLATLQSWIQACVTGVCRARSLEAPAASDGEAAQIDNIAVALATISDEFSMYASMLGQSRTPTRPEPGLPPAPRSLAATADDERLLLNCRAALRKSMQDLIVAMTADRSRQVAVNGVQVADQGSPFG